MYRYNEWMFCMVLVFTIPYWEALSFGPTHLCASAFIPESMLWRLHALSLGLWSMIFFSLSSCNNIPYHSDACNDLSLAINIFWSGSLEWISQFAITILSGIFSLSTVSKWYLFTLFFKSTSSYCRWLFRIQFISQWDSIAGLPMIQVDIIIFLVQVFLVRLLPGAYSLDVDNPMDMVVMCYTYSIS